MIFYNLDDSIADDEDYIKAVLSVSGRPILTNRIYSDDHNRTNEYKTSIKAKSAKPATVLKRVPITIVREGKQINVDLKPGKWIAGRKFWWSRHEYRCESSSMVGEGHQDIKQITRIVKLKGKIYLELPSYSRSNRRRRFLYDEWHQLLKRVPKSTCRNLTDQKQEYLKIEDVYVD